MASKSSSERSDAIRIACIGSSVTKGTGVADPAAESYPVYLAAFLQAHGYPPVNVRNFGEGGAGILKRGCNPYWDTDQYGDALAFEPDVLIINLGTNDSREEFWNNGAAALHPEEDIFAAHEQEDQPTVHGEVEFEQDLEELVEIFGMMSKPKTFLCTPVPLFHSNGWLKPEILCTEIAPRIRGVAARKGLRVVELFDSMLAQHPDLFPDGIHPSATGAAEISALIGQVLLKDMEEDEQEDDLNESSGNRGKLADHEGTAAQETEVAVEHENQQMVEEERRIVQQTLMRSKMYCNAAPFSVSTDGLDKGSARRGL